MTKFFLPIVILLTLLVAFFKKIDAYSSFVFGAKKSFEIVLDVFPYILAIMVVVALFKASGLSRVLIFAVSPIFKAMGIPVEVCELILLKPFTGSGSFALLTAILKTYGPDSYVGRCASVISSSSETLFYVSAVYFSKTSIKKIGPAILIGLFVSFSSSVIACFVCRFI